MGSRNPSYVIEIETHLSNISDELKKYEKELTSAQRELSNNPANKQLEKTILSLMDKIGDLKESYTSTIRKLSEIKLDSSQFDEFTKRFESSMQEINEKITEVEKKFFELSQGLGSFKGNDKLASQVDGMRRQMKNFMSDMKDAITVVKDLQEVISMKFDDRELQKVDKAISKLQGIDLAVGKSNVQTDDIKQLKKDLMELVYSYEELKGAMNNTNNSPQQTRRIQAEMAENLKQREQIIKKMSQLKGDVNPLNSNYAFTTNGFKQSISKMAQDVESETDELLSTLTDSRTEIAKRVESLADSASTTASSFQFKDGGIRIPVLLDPEAISKLQPEFKSMVDTLNEYAQKNPVDVVFRLFPMSGTRSEENELAKSIKDIRAQIPKTDDEELRGQLDSFVNNLEKQYQQAIKVRIAIELSETADDITKDIEKIKKAAKEANIPIYPTFEISDAESTKLRETLAKIQGDFSFDITDKITSMSESLNKLLSTTNINEWSDAFINALTKVQSKLESMKDLIQPLADLTVSQKVKNGRGRPSKETVENRSYVESFTSAIDALNRALSEKKKLETNTKDFVPNIQADIDKSGQSVMIPVKPKIDGFIEELQTLVDNSGITLGVDGGSGDGGDGGPSGGGSGGLKSKQSSSKKTVDGINAEATAKKKKIEISKEELQLQDKFNKKLDLYLEKYGEMENATSETKRKAAQNVLFGMSKADPILNRITSRNVSKLDRERLFSEYYQSKTGKTRDWTHYSLDAQYELIQEYAKNKKYNKAHSAGLKKIVENYLSYQEAGGTKTLEGISDNKRVQKNLKNEYEAQTAAIKENEEAKKSNNAVNEKAKDNSAQIKKETDAIQKKVEAEKEETEAKKKTEVYSDQDYGDLGSNQPDAKALKEYEAENEQIKKNTQAKEEAVSQTKQQEEAQELMNRLVDAANAKLEAEKQAIDATNTSLEKNNQLKKENASFNIEQQFDSWKKQLAEEGGLDLRTKKGKGNLDWLVNQYNLYKQNSGSRDITELSDDVNIQKKLKSAYEATTQAIKEVKQAKEETASTPSTTEANISKIDKENQKLDENIQKTKEDAKAKEENNLLLGNTANSDNETPVSTDASLQESTKQKAKKQGEEVGESVVEGAIEGTKKTQKSDSPSKVAEALGGDWGTGYANGILKSKEEVEAAVRDLVTSGKMTASELPRDQKSTRNSSQQNTENLKKEETQAEATAKANKELSSSRQISSLKGQITKIANQIANDPELTMQKYAEGVTKAAEYINKLKELGAETSEIKQKFLNITENAYQKIKPIDTSESREQIAKEKEELNEMPEAANKAAEAKEEFASANKQVLSSIVESLKGLSSEGNAFDGLNKLINNLGGKNGDEKLEKTVNGLKEIYDVLNQDIGENALIRTLNELAGKGSDLEHLATVLKSTKKQVENAKNAMDTSMQDGLSSLMGEDVVSENARTFLSQFGDVVNMTQELKNGFVQITSTVLTADNQFKRYILTTKDGINMTVSKTEEHTASLEKQILLYQKLLRASQNFNKVNPNTTSEAFIEKDSEIWKEVVGYAEEYGNDLGEIYSITRSVREANGELLESFKIIGKNGSVTIGAENDVVGSVQNLGDLTKQLKKLYRLQDLLENISGDKSGKYTSGYIDNVKAMIDQINSESFNITNPEDVTRLNALVDDATELYRLAKDTNNEIGNSRALENIRGKISDILNKYQAMPQTLKDQFEDLRQRTKNLIDTGSTKKQVQEISNEFVKLNANLSESGRKYQGLFAQMFERLRSQSSQLLAQYLSFYDIIRYIRTAITTLVDLDTQLVDLRKTTSMTTTELNQFYKASSDVGKELGVTTSEIISQAAAWSRLNKIGLLYGNI